MYMGDHGMFSSLFALYPLINILNFIVAIVFYVLSGIGYYNMANNTGMKNPWMAWVPFCREYLMGSIADRYNANAYGKQSKLRIILTVINAIVIPILYVFTFVIFFTTMVSMDNHYGYSWMSLLGEIIFYCLIVMAVAVAYKVFYLISYYKTFQDFEPSNAVLYTVIAFFGFGAIPVFISRNNVPVGVAGGCSPKQPQYNVNPSNFNGFNNYNNPNQNPNPNTNTPPYTGNGTQQQYNYSKDPSQGNYAYPPPPPPSQPTAGNPYPNQGMAPPPPPPQEQRFNAYPNQGMNIPQAPTTPPQAPPTPPQEPPQAPPPPVTVTSTVTPVPPMPDPELELPKVSVMAGFVQPEEPEAPKEPTPTEETRE